MKDFLSTMGRCFRHTSIYKKHKFLIQCIETFHTCLMQSNFKALFSQGSHFGICPKEQDHFSTKHRKIKQLQSDWNYVGEYLACSFLDVLSNALDAHTHICINNPLNMSKARQKLPSYVSHKIVLYGCS